MKKYYHDHAMKLFQSGYKPIPVRPGAKDPFFKKGETWQVDITEQVVAEWQANGKGGGGIGLTGLGALDFDILDKDVSNQLIKIVRENFGADIAIRVGQPPKFLVPVSPKSGIDKKWKNVWLDQKNVEHKIEFLAPGTQYFVAIGIHPDTKKEFQWVGQDILSMPANSLPVFENLDISMIEDEFDRIAETKGWVRKGTHPKNEDSKALDDFANLKFPGDVPISDLKLLVDQLPQEACDDYDQWIRYGAAIHHASNGSDDGYQIFDEWSRKSTKYKDEDDTLKRWNSWNSSKLGGATVGSIIHTVKECGGMPEVQEKKSTRYEDQISAACDKKEIRAIMKVISKDKTLDKLAITDIAVAIREKIREFKGAWKLSDIREFLRPKLKTQTDIAKPDPPEWLQPWVYVCHHEAFCYARSEIMYSRQAFSAMYDRHLVDSDKYDSDNAYDFAVKEVQIPVVHGALYNPGADTFFEFDGNSMVNTYNPETRGDRKPKDKWNYDDITAIAVLEDHIKEMFPEPGDAQTLLDVMAYVAQNEGKRVNWMLILYGCEGDGKTMILTTLARCLGSSNVGIINASDIIEHSFSDWANGHRLKLVEELKISGSNRYAIANKFKPFITNPEISVHPKGRKPYKTINTATYIATTNHLDALPLSDAGRRFAVVRSKWMDLTELIAEKGDDYFASLHKLLDDHYDAINEWHCTREISSVFNPHIAPKSDAFQDAVELNKNDDVLMIEEIISDPKYPEINEHIVDTGALGKILIEDKNMVIQGRTMALLLSRLGYRRVPWQVKISGKVARVWVRKTKIDRSEDKRDEMNKKIRELLGTPF